MSQTSISRASDATNSQSVSERFFSARSLLESSADYSLNESLGNDDDNGICTPDPDASYYGGGSHGVRPPWGWDYMLVFKIPRSIRNLLEKQRDSTDKNHSPLAAESISTPDTVRVVENVFSDGDEGNETDEKSNKRIEQRVDILTRLMCAGFAFSQVIVPSQNVILVRLSLPEKVLKRKAEYFGMELRLKDEYGGGYLKLTESREAAFINDTEQHERQCYFGPADRSMIILAALQSKEHWGCDLNIEQLIYDKVLIQAFSLHSQHEHARLIRKVVWNEWWNPCWNPPFMLIKDYFGTRISLYFVFVSFYAKRLFILAVLSIPVYIVYRYSNSELLITIVRWIFAIGLVLWATYFLETWKRRCGEVGVIWGVDDFHEDEESVIRAQFRGELRHGFYCSGGFVALSDLCTGTDTETGGGGGCIRLRNGSVLQLPQNPYESLQRQRRVQFESLVITLAFVVVMGALTFVLIWFRSEIVSYFEGKSGNATLANALPGIMNGVLTVAADSLWRPVSYWLTKRENLRTNHQFSNSLIYKRFAFQFVSNYMSLFFIAFVRPYLPTTCRLGRFNGRPDCMLELENQMVSLVLTKATIGQAMEIGIPLISKLYNEKVGIGRHGRRSTCCPSPCSSCDASKRGICSSSGANTYILQTKLAAYNSCMEDYSEVVMQFGYLVLFGLAFPVACAVNVVNNIIEVRTDAYKMAKLSQRPTAEEGGDIGAWYVILEFLNLVSVVTNVALLVFTNDSVNVVGDLDGRLGDDEGSKMLWRVVVFFAVEHALLLTKGLMCASIGDITSATRRSQARQRFEKAVWFDEEWRDAYRGERMLQMDEPSVLAMDLLDGLQEPLLIDSKDPFEGELFTCDFDLLDPKPDLVLDPFESATPLANIPHVPNHPITADPLSAMPLNLLKVEPHLPPPLPLTPPAALIPQPPSLPPSSSSSQQQQQQQQQQAVLLSPRVPHLLPPSVPSPVGHPVRIGSAVPVQQYQHPVGMPKMASLPDPPSPLQENRPSKSHNQSAMHAGNRTAGGRLRTPGKAKVDRSPDQKSKDKLAQRKLRNKESARRYREKQVARRKQLENYTRTLSEQNRELEILHEKLIRLTCERRMNVGVGGGVGMGVVGVGAPTVGNAPLHSDVDALRHNVM